MNNNSKILQSKLSQSNAFNNDFCSPKDDENSKSPINRRFGNEYLQSIESRKKTKNKFFNNQSIDLALVDSTLNIDNAEFKHISICHSQSQISSQNSNRRKMSHKADGYANETDRTNPSYRHIININSRYPKTLTREMRDRQNQKKNLNEYVKFLRLQRLEAKQFENLKSIQKSSEFAEMNAKIKEYQQECK